MWRAVLPPPDMFRGLSPAPLLVAERDEGEFARLSQLGDILGLTQMDVYQVRSSSSSSSSSSGDGSRGRQAAAAAAGAACLASPSWLACPATFRAVRPTNPCPPCLLLPAPPPQVHTGMAEQAFKQNVQSVLGDGNLTPDRAAALEKMREQVGGWVREAAQRRPVPQAAQRRSVQQAVQRRPVQHAGRRLLCAGCLHPDPPTATRLPAALPSTSCPYLPAFPASEQMGLPKENADKIIRGFSNQKAIQGMQASAGPGCWVAAEGSQGRLASGRQALSCWLL